MTVPNIGSSVPRTPGSLPSKGSTGPSVPLPTELFLQRLEEALNSSRSSKSTQTPLYQRSTPKNSKGAPPPPEVLKFLEVLGWSDRQSASTLLSAAGGGAPNVISAHSFFLRNIFFTQWTAAPMWTGPCVNDVMGITTGLNAFWGANAVLGAQRAYFAADALNDRTGRADALRDLSTGIFQTLGGAAYLVLRPLTVAAQVLGATWAVVTNVGIVGTILWGFFYLSFMVWGGYRLHDLRQFEAELKAKGSDPAACAKLLFDHLEVNAKAKFQKMLNAPDSSEALRQNPEGIKGFFQNLYTTMGGKVGGPKGRKDYLNALEKDGLSLLVDQFLELQEKMTKEGGLSGNSLSKAEVANVFKKLFEKVDPQSADFKKLCEQILKPLGIDVADAEALQLSALQVFGFSAALQRSQKKRDAIYGRIMGGDAVSEVHKAFKKGLDIRLNPNFSAIKPEALTEARSLIGRVETGLSERKWYYIAAVVSGALGVIISVATAGMFVLNPAALITLSVLTVITILVMFHVDYSSWQAGMQSGPIGKFDKGVALAMAAIMTIATLTVIGLTIAYGLPFIGVTALTAGLLIGIPSIAFALYCYYKLEQKDKKWKEDHPTLENVEQALSELSTQRKQVPEWIMEMVKKLDKKELHALQSEFYTRHVESVPPVALEAALKTAKTNREPDLLRACVKTSKIYWKKARLSGKAQDLQAAQALQNYIDLLKQADLIAADTQFKGLRNNRELYQTLSKTLFFVKKMKEDVALTKKMVELVKKNHATQTPLRAQEEKKVMERAQAILSAA
jgi:hypothetical protein